jgi:hypothetical protein
MVVELAGLRGAVERDVEEHILEAAHVDLLRLRGAAAHGEGGLVGEELGEIHGVGARNLVLPEEEIAGLALGGDDDGVELVGVVRRGFRPGGLGRQSGTRAEQQRGGNQVGSEFSDAGMHG